MTEERKQQIIEEQIEILASFNKMAIDSEPEQVRLNSETIIKLIDYLPNTRELNWK